MKKTVFTAIFLSTSILGIYGQVETRFFPNRDALQQNRLLKEHRGVAKIKAMPPLDIQKIASARQQERDDNVPFRFGEGFDTRITLADGEWTDTENGRLWTMAIESKGAYSINFVFNDFYLPEGAELYISNEEGDMLYGPVTSKANTENGHFLTDLIKGDKVSIYLFEPSNKRNESQLTIKRVVHAYLDLYGNLNGSLDCNNNIACFPAWSNESDAVALVLLSNGTEWCSGSLLMTANQSFRPYFLSAFHCIDTDIPKGSLSSSEISNAENWMFKFQYKMSSCSGGYATSGVTYNRATFRAAWNNTDFALMELRNSPAGDPRFSWLGWDRSGNTPTSGTGIHHPAGDVMKISFDYNSLSSNTSTISWTGGTSSPVNTHWVVELDSGTMEGGSSGAPLFNQNKRVVGQLHGGASGCAPVTKYFGQFHRSWTGGGTNSTRLSNWLDPNGSGVMTTNTSKSPTISGPTSVCNQATYTIENLPPGAIVQWSAHPALQISSQQNNAIVVSGTTITGGCWIGAEISPPFDRVLRKENITVWQSGINETPHLIQGEITPTGGNVRLSNEILAGTSNYYWWTDYETWTAVSQGMPYTLFTGSYNPSVADSASIIVDLTTPCGESVTLYRVFRWGNFRGNPPSFTLSPNPATDMVTVRLEEETAEAVSEFGTRKITSPKVYEIQLWSAAALIRTYKTDQSVYQISVSDLPKGMYFVRVTKEGKTQTKKLLKN